MSRKIVFGVWAFLLLVAVFGVVLNVPLARGSGTIYIKADGSVDPPTAPITSVDNITYTFTDNIYDEIVVERSNIIIDGNGYTLQGTGAFFSKGIYLFDIVNVTIIGTNIKDFHYGVYFHSSSYNTVSANNITNSGSGVYVYNSSYNSIVGNNITNSGSLELLYSSYNTIYGNKIYNSGGVSLFWSSNNSLSGNNITNGWRGVWLYLSSNNVLKNNSMVGNRYNFGVTGDVLSHFVQDVDASNTVDEKPIYYWIYRQNEEVPYDAGYVALINSYNITVKGLELKKAYCQGILLANTTNSKLTNNNITDNYWCGVELWNSSYNTVSGNNITANDNDGIHLGWSSNNSIVVNNITNNYHGVYLDSSSNNNTIFGNIITNNGDGLDVYISSYNSISGNNIAANEYNGIELRDSNYNSILGNNIAANNYHGIYLLESSSNSISGNNITNNGWYGVHLVSSSNNVLKNNSMVGNRYNFGVWGDELSYFIQDVDSSNTVDGKPIYYWVNSQNMEVPSDAGYVALVNSSNIIVKRLELKNNIQGVLLAYTTKSKITNNNITNNGWSGVYVYNSSYNSIVRNNITNNYWCGVELWNSSYNTISINNITENCFGVELWYSSYNTISRNNIANSTASAVVLPYSSYNSISRNNITNNGWCGVELEWSSNSNTLCGNNITNNYWCGVDLLYSSDNRISGNNIANNKFGIWLEYSSGNIIVGNNIMANNRYGIYLYYSSNNSISGNNITNNWRGIYLHHSSNYNNIYHNNFINNTQQVSIYESYDNVWDDGYPSGGNYWSDYTGQDLNGDGIGDVPYIIDENNRDRYPLMSPWVDMTPPVTINDYDNLWRNIDFTITLTATDESGVAETYYKINDGLIQNVSAHGQPLITTESANNTLEYWSVDNAGNEEIPHKVLTEIKLDKTAPSGTILINNDDANTTTVTVTLNLSASDATSGVSQMRFSNDGTTWTTWKAYTPSKSWNLTVGEGTKTVYAQYKDKAGLISPTYNDTITLLDATHPTTTISLSGVEGANGWFTSNVTVTLSATDDISGVEKTEYSLDNVTWSTYTAPFTVSAEGNTTVYYKSTDKAGNVETMKIGTIKIDKTLPTIRIPSRMPDGDVLPEQEVKVSVNVTDFISGIKNVTLYYTLNNGTTWEEPIPMNLNSSTGLYEATIPGQPAGTWVKYKIIAYDNAENQQTKDGTAPQCAYQVIPEFPPALIPPLLIALTLITIILTKKKLPKNPTTNPK